MNLRKYRWSKTYESSEEELFTYLAAKQIAAERWDAAGDESFPVQTYGQDKQLWCAEGSVVFTANGHRFSLQPGDGLDIPAFISYEALVGFSGCVCYEWPAPAHNPPLSSASHT